MIGLISMLVTALTPLAKSAMTFAKWVVAQGRLLAGHAWMLWNWWLKYSQHSIVLRIAVWAAWTAAIEVAFAVLSNYTIEPLSRNFISLVLPNGGYMDGLLYAFWDAGCNAKIAVRCIISYLGLYLFLQSALRQAQRTVRLYQSRYVNPRVFST